MLGKIIQKIIRPDWATFWKECCNIMGSTNESSVQMHRIIFLNDFLDDSTVRMLIKSPF